jgi:hypothetical protein
VAKEVCLSKTANDAVLREKSGSDRLGAFSPRTVIFYQFDDVRKRGPHQSEEMDNGSARLRVMLIISPASSAQSGLATCSDTSLSNTPDAISSDGLMHTIVIQATDNDVETPPEEYKIKEVVRITSRPIYGASKYAGVVAKFPERTRALLRLRFRCLVRNPARTNESIILDHVLGSGCADGCHNSSLRHCSDNRWLTQ